MSTFANNRSIWENYMEERKKHPSWLFFEYSRVLWNSSSKRKSKKTTEELSMLYDRLNKKDKTLADNLKDYYKG